MPLDWGTVNLPEVFRKASVNWDGGYALAGIVGNGDALQWGSFGNRDTSFI